MITVSQNSTINNPQSINRGEFKSLPISHQSKPVAISLNKTKLIKKQKTLPHFKIGFPDFDYKFSFEIIDIQGELISNEINLYLKFDDNVIKAVLSGDRKAGEGLYINNFGFEVKKQGKTSISTFLLKTLWAMVSLAKKIKVQIPDLKQEATMSFEANSKDVSSLLQIRELAYRVMVIEKTFKIILPFPEFIDGKEVENIAYFYHSIVDRKFEWFCSPTINPWYATQRYLSLLPKKNVPFPIQYGPEVFEREIFGCLINLGLQTAKIENYILDNFDEVRTKLSKLNGSEVLVKAHSENGVMLVESITTPVLPTNAFSKDIQKLIDLETKLNDAVFEKYINSFSNAFEGLSDKQIKSLTEKPKLEENAFNF